MTSKKSIQINFINFAYLSGSRERKAGLAKPNTRLMEKASLKLSISPTHLLPVKVFSNV
jgi:hypothetical protein